MCNKRYYDSKRILTWDWRKCLIIIYTFSLREAFRHKSRFESFYIPFRVIFGFVDPFIAYCLGSFRNCFLCPKHRWFSLILFHLPWLQAILMNERFSWLLQMRWCGGINPYTLTPRIGPARTRGSGPLEDDTRPGQSVRSPAQGIKIDLEIKQDPGQLE